jgi:hypothetical protein
MKWSALLEWFSSIVLIASVAAVAWIFLAAYQPAWLRLETVEMEVVVVIGLLVTALLLVSAIALVDTARSRESEAKETPPK